jgi:hypothetical protein
VQVLKGSVSGLGVDDQRAEGRETGRWDRVFKINLQVENIRGNLRS